MDKDIDTDDKALAKYVHGIWVTKPGITIGFPMRNKKHLKSYTGKTTTSVVDGRIIIKKHGRDNSESKVIPDDISDNYLS